MVICQEIHNDQVEYICNKVMLLARELDTQYQCYNKTIHKKFLEKMPVLLPKYDEPNRCKEGIIGILFKAIVVTALEAVSAFIKQRMSKALYNALPVMGKQCNF